MCDIMVAMDNTRDENNYVQIAVFESTRLRWNRLKTALSYREGRPLTNDDLMNMLIALGEGINHATNDVEMALPQQK